MLIVNADDFGRSVTETDSATTLLRRRRVTSLSAMVFMQDSERAADLANELNADVGLHLNFCEPWTNRAVPTWLRAYHESLVTFFNSSRYAFLIYKPSLRRAFDAVYQAEVDQFARIYRRPPSHIDGHRHLHLCANMLIDGVIPLGSSVRRNFTFARGEKALLNRTYRWVVDKFLRRNYELTDYFFSLERCLNGEGKSVHRVAELAKHASVEVMTHPRNSSEFQYLDGEGYQAVLGRVAKGTYSELPLKGRIRFDSPVLWSLLAGMWQCVLM